MLFDRLSMLFVIEVFGEPDSLGNARIIERRTHTGPTVSEALQTARANLRMPPPSAYCRTSAAYRSITEIR
jgi:hypothetical protein